MCSHSEIQDRKQGDYRTAYEVAQRDIDNAAYQWYILCIRVLSHGREEIMFGRKQREGAPDTIETVIGPTANIVGDLKSDGGVRIGGVLEGSLETAGNLAVEEKARILGDISAHNASIAGTVKGNITANRVEVLSTGQVWGDISVNSFLLDDGGFIRGHVNMQVENSKSPWPGSPAAGIGSGKESA